MCGVLDCKKPCQDGWWCENCNHLTLRIVQCPLTRKPTFSEVLLCGLVYCGNDVYGIDGFVALHSGHSVVSFSLHTLGRIQEVHGLRLAHGLFLLTYNFLKDSNSWTLPLLVFMFQTIRHLDWRIGLQGVLSSTSPNDLLLVMGELWRWDKPIR